MKTASLKIAVPDTAVSGLDKYRDYTGAQLHDRYSKAPVGFYRNTDESFLGIVFRDINGNCTYFDRTHGMVYEMELEVWEHSMFTFLPNMKSLSILFAKKKHRKKVKKTVDVAAA